MIDHVDDGGLDQGERAELEAYRTAFAAISEVCLQAGAGDLEARVPILDGGDDIAVVRNAINRLLDLTDAFVREAAASLLARLASPRELVGVAAANGGGAGKYDAGENLDFFFYFFSSGVCVSRGLGNAARRKRLWEPKRKTLTSRFFLSPSLLFSFLFAPLLSYKKPNRARLRRRPLPRLRRRGGRGFLLLLPLERPRRPSGPAAAAQLARRLPRHRAPHRDGLGRRPGGPLRAAQRLRQPAAVPELAHALLQLPRALALWRRARARITRSCDAGPAGAAGGQQAAPVGPARHVHRADQEPEVRVLGPPVHAVRGRGREAVRERGEELHGAAAAAGRRGRRRRRGCCCRRCWCCCDCGWWWSWTRRCAWRRWRGRCCGLKKEKKEGESGRKREKREREKERGGGKRKFFVFLFAQGERERETEIMGCSFSFFSY